MKLFKILVTKVGGGYQRKFRMLRNVIYFTAKNQQLFNAITQVTVT